MDERSLRRFTPVTVFPCASSSLQSRSVGALDRIDGRETHLVGRAFTPRRGYAPTHCIVHATQLQTVGVVERDGVVEKVTALPVEAVVRDVYEAGGARPGRAFEVNRR